MSSKLIKCRVCGNSISNGANVCPYCGEKIKAGKMRSFSLGLIGVFLIIIGITSLYILDAMELDLEENYLLGGCVGFSLIGVFCSLIGFSSPSV